MRRILRKVRAEWSRYQTAKKRGPALARREAKTIRRTSQNPQLIVNAAEELYREAEKRGFLAEWTKEKEPIIGQTVESVSGLVIRTPEPVKQTIIQLGSAAVDWRRGTPKEKEKQLRLIIRDFTKIMGYFVPKWVRPYQNRFNHLTRITRQEWQGLRAVRAALTDLGYKPGKEREEIEYRLQVVGFINPNGQLTSEYMRNNLFQNDPFREKYHAFVRQYKRYLAAMQKENPPLK